MSVRSLCLALCLLFAATLAASTQEKMVVTTLLKTTTTAGGQKIVFPASNTEVTALIVDLPGGIDTGWHEHPYPRYGYVISGAVTVENESGAPQTYRAGEFVVEQIGVFHHGTTTAPTQLLVIDQNDAGKGNQINR
ncbi:MAG TPA: cupin domain-containing protein [Stellaceae bacterium]|jgi:quercetin dioxygenase-like cupin family protein|nr:cupin domain-containing protein [Stellaceae bacterium]